MQRLKLLILLLVGAVLALGGAATQAARPAAPAGAPAAHPPGPGKFGRPLEGGPIGPAAPFLTGPPALPEILDPHWRANVRANTDSTTFAQQEPSIAVNPLNHLNVVAAQKDERRAPGPGTVTKEVWIDTSTDGGLTWPVNVQVPLPAGDDPQQSDPVVTFSDNNHVFVTFIGFDQNAGLGTNIIMVARSTDGGLTWPTPAAQLDPTLGGSDKEWTAIDLNPASPYYHRLYVTWTNFSAGPQFIEKWSSDDGATWNPPGGSAYVTVSFGGFDGGQFSMPVTLPNGNVIATWNPGGGIAVGKSTDGGQSFINPNTQAVAITNVNSVPGSNWRLNTIPSTAANQASSTLVTVWADGRNGKDDIYFSRSTDGGTSWSAAARVAHNAAGSSYQVEPWISVAPNGRFDVIWYDDRDFPGALNTFNIYASHSTDDGATWTGPDEQASDAATNLNIGIPGGPGWNAAAGDYIGVISANDVAYGAWTDTRSGTNEDIYTGKYTPPSQGTPTATATGTPPTATRTVTPTGTATTVPPTPTVPPSMTPVTSPTVTLSSTPVASPTCGGPGAYRILIAYADTPGPTTLRTNLLAQPGVSVVDFFDARNDTPTVAQMQQYDLVLTYSNYTYADPTTLGDNLADYQDGGGIVITSYGALYFANGNRILGRWQNDGYSPYAVADTQLVNSVTLGAHDPSHPLMQGVTTLNAGARFATTPVVGATQVAAYSDGSAAVAFKTTAGHTAVSLPAFVGAGSGSAGYAQVIVNALHWLAPVPACGTPTNTPTPRPPSATPTCGGSGQAGPWVTASSYPATIGRYAFAQTGNDFYVISGVSQATIVDGVNRYNTGSGAWTSLASLPIPGEAPAAAYFNGKIYVAGGNAGGGVIAAFQIYDIATNTWAAGPNVPAATWGAAAGAYNGKVFVAGGNFLPTNALYVFDIASNTWTTGTAMPSAYFLGGYQQVGQYLYAIGGYGNTPQGAAPSLLNGQAGAAAPTDNSSVSQRLDMTGAPGVWTTGPVFTMQHGDFGLAYAHGTLYALGGDITGGSFFNPTAEVDALETTNWPAGTWATSLPALPSPRQANQAGFYSGSTIWSTGGIGPAASYLSEHLNRTMAFNACQSPTTTSTPTITATSTPTAMPPSRTAVPPSSTAMPSSRTPGATGTPCTISFSDVHPADYFYVPVQYLYCHGVISGYSNGTFRPYTATTRSQMVKIVVLGFNLPLTTPSGGNYTFADVQPSFPFFGYIETAAAHNIVSGYVCGGPGEPCDSRSRPYFRPYASVTRGQLSKITVVAAGWALLNPANRTFADVVPNTAFYTFVETAYCHGIISGYSCGSVPNEPCDPQNRPYFRQYNDATRGQIAKIVYLALTNGATCTAPTATR